MAGRRPAGRVLAALLVPAGLAAAAGLLAWSAGSPLAVVAAPGPAPVDGVVALGAAVAASALVLLMSIGSLVWLIAVVTGRCTGRLAAVGRLLAPAAARRAVCLALGAGLVMSGVPSAEAATAPGSRSTPAAGTGWSVDRPVAPPSPSTSSSDRPASRGATGPAPGGRPATAVVVRPGDSLWSISARRLGPRATDAQVARAWPRWYAANRTTVGADPDLIHPGQRLRRPPAVGERTPR